MYHWELIGFLMVLFYMWRPKKHSLKKCVSWFVCNVYREKYFNIANYFWNIIKISDYIPYKWVAKDFFMSHLPFASVTQSFKVYYADRHASSHESKKRTIETAQVLNGTLLKKLCNSSENLLSGWWLKNYDFPLIPILFFP